MSHLEQSANGSPYAVQPTMVAPQPVQPVWTQPTPKKSVGASFVLGVIGITLLSIVFILVAIYVLISLGPIASVFCAIIALLPLTVVLITIRLIDRWEPEPKGARWFAFLWGAAASVALALLVDAGVQILVYAASDGESVPSDFFGAVIQAPIVEEGAKGLGVLLLFLVLRKTFDGPVDGLVYGATVAAGFAFTENILYFGSSLLEGGESDLAFTFVLRGIMSPFAHVMFTACTGIALGFASRKRGWFAPIVFFVVGLIAAILLHALWNGSTFFTEDLNGFVAFYAVVQVPLFIMAIIAVILLRRAESRLTRTRLTEYATAGWFTAEEVNMLATGPGRRAAKAWARRTPGKYPVMKKFISDATALAFTRQRLITHREHFGTQRQEGELLQAIMADRGALLALPQPAAFSTVQPPQQ